MSSRPWNPAVPEVPVDNNGNWMDYPGYNQRGWLKIHQPFYATMTIDGMRTGRSSKKVILVDDKGVSYPMFVADLVKGIKNGSLEISTSENPKVGGMLTAWWTGSKMGANYGIRSVKV